MLENIPKFQCFLVGSYLVPGICLPYCLIALPALDSSHVRTVRVCRGICMPLSLTRTSLLALDRRLYNNIFVSFLLSFFNLEVMIK